MILDTTSKSIQIILGEAKTTNDCDITASFADSVSGTTFVPAANDLTSNGTTAVTVVAAPASSTQRSVQEIRLHNNDTVTHTVTLRLDNSGTFRTVMVRTIPAGSDFLYAPDIGYPPALADLAFAGTNTTQTTSLITPGSVSGNTPTDITTISLPPGVWLLFGDAVFAPSSGAEYYLTWINTVSATIPSPTNGSINSLSVSSSILAQSDGIPTGMLVLTLGTTTTVYLSGLIGPGGGTMAGILTAVPLTGRPA